jgi:hypothetical protein
MEERIYIRGNKEHWKDVCKYVYGMNVPETYSQPGICSNDKAIFVKNEVGGFTLYTDPITCDAITTNSNWREVKPWEKHYESKPFSKVFGWNNDCPSDIRPDIFLYESNRENKTIYVCAAGCWDHIEPYNEKEYTERIL